MSTSPDLAAVRSYLLALQETLCTTLEKEDGTGKFRTDEWTRPEASQPGLGGGGRTRILADGAVFEKAGVAFSHVRGTTLPPSATAHRPELAGKTWEALGVSLVIHPRNPYVPTAHANIRFFIAGSLSTLDTATPPTSTGARPPALGDPPSPVGDRPTAIGDQLSAITPAQPTWWFGGGFDLTPYYGFEDDARHWHRTARAAVAPFGDTLYPRLKKSCDDYFFLKHRNEPRGIGGLFFDDFNELGFEGSFALARAVGGAFIPAYRPIVARRKATPHGERERQFQLYRRGRYVEFNLVWDRGTLFGLQSGGRTESILMSLPPLVRWDYDWKPEPHSPEARLHDVFLQTRDWAGLSDSQLSALNPQHPA